MLASDDVRRRRVGALAVLVLVLASFAAYTSLTWVPREVPRMA